MTIKEDHIENHTTKYSIWRLGIQYSEKYSSCNREKAKNRQMEFAGSIRRETKYTIINNVAADRNRPIYIF